MYLVEQRPDKSIRQKAFTNCFGPFYAFEESVVTDKRNPTQPSSGLFRRTDNHPQRCCAIAFVFSFVDTIKLSILYVYIAPSGDIAVDCTQFTFKYYMYKVRSITSSSHL